MDTDVCQFDWAGLNVLPWVRPSQVFTTVSDSLARFAVSPRPPGLLEPWNPGTDKGVTDTDTSAPTVLDIQRLTY